MYFGLDPMLCVFTVPKSIDFPNKGLSQKEKENAAPSGAKKKKETINYKIIAPIGAIGKLFEENSCVAAKFL